MPSQHVRGRTREPLDASLELVGFEPLKPSHPNTGGVADERTPPVYITTPRLQLAVVPGVVDPNLDLTRSYLSQIYIWER